MKAYFGFQRKTVVVTGASSGMVEAAAKMLVDLSAEVHACGSGKQSRITDYPFGFAPYKSEKRHGGERLTRAGGQPSAR